MDAPIMKLIAPNGAYLLSGTTAFTAKTFFGIIPRSDDPIISAWTDEDGADLVAEFGLSGQILEKGDLPLLVPRNKRSQNITLAAGSVWLLL